MVALEVFGYIGFVISVSCLFGIMYLRKRIAELTIATGILIDRMKELEKEDNL